MPWPHGPARNLTAAAHTQRLSLGPLHVFAVNMPRLIKLLQTSRHQVVRLRLALLALAPLALVLAEARPTALLA